MVKDPVALVWVLCKCCELAGKLILTVPLSPSARANVKEAHLPDLPVVLSTHLRASLPTFVHTPASPLLYDTGQAVQPLWLFPHLKNRGYKYNTYLIEF